MNSRGAILGSFLVLSGLVLEGCGGGGYSGSSSGYPMPVTLTGISITPASAKIITGTTATLEAIGSYSDGTTANLSNAVVWTSNSPATASVATNSGLVMGNLAGTTDITAAISTGTYGVISSPPVGVTVTGSTPTAISVDPPTASAAKGATATFTATGTFQDGTAGNVSGSATWTSSDTAVAAVNASGIAMCVGPGSTTITATLQGILNTATLTVF